MEYATRMEQRTPPMDGRALAEVRSSLGSPFSLGDLFEHWRQNKPGSGKKQTEASTGEKSQRQGIQFELIQSNDVKSRVHFQDVVRTSRNKTIIVVGGDKTRNPFGTAWHQGYKLFLDPYPVEFQEWFESVFAQSILATCRPRQIKKFRRLSKWCRSMVKGGKCSFGVKCNFCHHFSEFSPMRCENDGKCDDPQCWYMHSAEVQQQVGNFMQVQLRQIYAIVKDGESRPAASSNTNTTPVATGTGTGSVSSAAIPIPSTTGARSPARRKLPRSRSPRAPSTNRSERRSSFASAATYNSVSTMGSMSMTNLAQPRSSLQSLGSSALGSVTGSVMSSSVLGSLNGSPTELNWMFD